MPENIQIKARALLARYFAGELHARKRPRYDRHYLVINVGYQYRILCLKPERRRDPEAWELMTHERYNNAIARRP
ncbi:TPA: hypothetical protein QH074_004302 [Enterobacter hormaechei subsp. steigerwaltii]|nr:hypothetical protein [Enterobacter hormaechei subsp. steigerwaltii]